MDQRVAEHASIIVDHCVSIEPGDDVLVSAPTETEELVAAVNERIGAHGGHPTNVLHSPRVARSFMRGMDPADYESHSTAYMRLAEETDVAISVRGSANVHETADVSAATDTAYTKLSQPIREEMASTRRVLTQHPTAGDAQRAEMSTAGFADLVYDAVTLDWDAQRAFQAPLVQLLTHGETVHVEVGDRTDLRFDIDGMVGVSDHGERNLPGGEVYTAPVTDSVTGTVQFDFPAVVSGSTVEGLRLTFEDGEVVTYEATHNESVIGELLDADAGARRVGEFGVGMNRHIQQPTRNLLFDEKMGGTIHLALGTSIAETVGPDRTGNESSVHQDLLVDVSTDATLSVDGRVIQRDGRFVFESGYESG